jgi:peptidoglycan/LPS O-acetylase OafA/YrhL
MKKTNAIYFWKIIFTYMIIIYHFDNPFPYSGEMGFTPGWYIAVEFFFVVSGFLVADAAAKGRYETALSYTVHRYKKLWPKYIVAFVLTFAAIWYVNQLSLLQAADKLLDSYWEILLLQGIGLGRGWDYINPTLWYISIMLLVGYFLYYFLRNHRKVFLQIILPVIIIVGYSFLYREVGCTNTVVEISGIYVNNALIRGGADMCMGILAYEANRYLLEKQWNSKALRCISPLIFVGVILISMKRGCGTLDFLYVFLLTAAIAIAFLPCEGKEKTVMWVERISSLSYTIYLLHDLFRSWIFPKILFTGTYDLAQKMKIMVIYVLTITVCAVLFDWLFVLGKKAFAQIRTQHTD